MTRSQETLILAALVIAAAIATPRVIDALRPTPPNPTPTQVNAPEPPTWHELDAQYERDRSAYESKYGKKDQTGPYWSVTTPDGRTFQGHGQPPEQLPR